MTESAIESPRIVFGLGQTGLSVARYFAANDLEFAVIDSREHPPSYETLMCEFPNVPIICGVESALSIAHCEQLIISPGISRSHPIVVAALERGIEVIGDIELFARHVNAPIVAVTGSNGKSTVVSIVAEILSAAGLNVRTGGNIGIPALDLIAEDEPDCYVLELSSFQLESVDTFAPAVAALLNVSQDHMDRYASFSDYRDAKCRIFEKANVVVLNADDPELSRLHPECRAVFLSGESDARAQYRVTGARNRRQLEVDGVVRLSDQDIKLSGDHNLLNALAAIAITDQLSVPVIAQAQVIRRFEGLAHRCQLVASINRVDWIDDSKGTNIGATCAAVKGVFAARRGVLIAGGQGKGADFSELRATLSGRIHSVVLIGEDARRIADEIGDVAQVSFALDMRAAVQLAARLAQSGEAVLLSPACASLDMFSGFAERGLAFAAAVREVATT